MTISSAIALFSVLLVLGLIPGPSSLAVVARSLSGGLRSGLTTAFGVLSGDYIFIVLAALGMSAMAEAMGCAFTLVKYAAAVYLIYFGITILLSRHSRMPQPGTPEPAKASAKGLAGDYLTGLLVTLSNPKAILFYMSILPAVLDFDALSIIDVLLVLLIATVVLGGLLVIYIWLAVKAKNAAQAQSHSMTLIATGALIAGRS